MKIYCEICTELFEETKVAATTVCGHVFHERCIRTWLTYSRTCPKCRNPVEEDNITRLYFSTFASETESAGCSENELSNLKTIVHRQQFEIMKKRAEEVEVKYRIRQIQMRAVRLEQRLNAMQLRHMKVIASATQLCQSLKNVVDNLISTTRTMRSIWERDGGRQRRREIPILRNSLGTEKSQRVPVICNDCTRKIRSRNSASENMATNSPSDIRRRILEIRILNAALSSESSQNISPAHNLHSRNTRSTSVFENMASENMATSDIACDYGIRSNRLRRPYLPPYDMRHIYIRREDAMPGTSSSEVSTHSGIYSPDRELGDYDVINIPAMDQN